MSDNKSQPLSVELITNCMNDLARDIGVMDPNDPRWVTVVEELSLLKQLRRSLKLAGNPVAGQCTDELAPQTGRSSA